MQKFSRSWDRITKISYLQRRIIVASIIYYEYDENIITDFEYTELCQQLVKLQTGIDISPSTYGYAFKDFDGSTGFDLFYKLNSQDQEYLKYIAMYLVNKCTISELANSVPTQNNKQKKKGKLF